MRRSNGEKRLKVLMKGVSALIPKKDACDESKDENVFLVDNPTIQFELHLQEYVQQKFFADMKNIEEKRTDCRPLTESQAETPFARKNR